MLLRTNITRYRTAKRDARAQFCWLAPLQVTAYTSAVLLALRQRPDCAPTRRSPRLYQFSALLPPHVPADTRPEVSLSRQRSDCSLTRVVPASRHRWRAPPSHGAV